LQMRAKMVILPRRGGFFKRSLKTLMSLTLLGIHRFSAPV
jgi:hypothetical protein